MSKFKVGDKVEITKNLSSHFFNIGDIVKIITVGVSGVDYCAEDNYDSWWVNNNELKLFKDKKPITKDSGKRISFPSGMVRDVEDDKPQYDLVDFDMLKRWAELMARGAKKYGRNNWKKAEGQEELDRFKASALRHLIQWFEGQEDEDHASAVYFNIAGAEMVKKKMNGKRTGNKE